MSRPARAKESPTDVSRLGVRGGHTDDQARGRDDAVVGPEHRGAKPADAVRPVPFDVPHVRVLQARWATRMRGFPQILRLGWPGTLRPFALYSIRSRGPQA